MKHRRGYKLPKGPGLRQELLYERKASKSRYYKLLSGHAATGADLCNRLGKIPSDKCGRDGRQTCCRLLVECEAWAPQSKALWRSVGKAFGWKHPRASRIEMYFEEQKATSAVLTFLWETKVGEAVSLAALRGGRSGELPVEAEGEEGIAPLVRMQLLFCPFRSALVFPFFIPLGEHGERGIKEPTLTAGHRMALREIAGRGRG